MKFGFDYHGVIDKYPTIFRELFQALLNSDHEVHIITGTAGKEMVEELERLHIPFTIVFSINDHLLKQFTPLAKDDFGRPIFPEEAWNMAKAQYCKEVGIDFHLDDTEAYGEHFQTPFALFKKVRR